VDLRCYLEDYLRAPFEACPAGGDRVTDRVPGKCGSGRAATPTTERPAKTSLIRLGRRERAGVTVAPIVFTDDTDGPPPSGGHFGVSYWGGVGAPALVGYFPGGQGDRMRFTLGHEVGHLVLHTFRPLIKGKGRKTAFRVVARQTPGCIQASLVSSNAAAFTCRFGSSSS
jgi:hypothetical protein